jgi:hypothetical protein
MDASPARIAHRALLTACRGPVLALMLACWLLDVFAEPLTWLREAIGYVLGAAVAGLAWVDDELRRRIGRLSRMNQAPSCDKLG